MLNRAILRRILTLFRINLTTIFHSICYNVELSTVTADKNNSK